MPVGHLEPPFLHGGGDCTSRIFDSGPVRDRHNSPPVHRTAAGIYFQNPAEAAGAFYSEFTWHGRLNGDSALSFLNSARAASANSTDAECKLRERRTPLPSL